ncbi:hypothetical protein L1049_005274 [Liquidambar formosana]|uniref:Uncharacterized protein n=1 Tax=Liquidambar formosana TaxID=63359 RepID=A0AAP0RPM8_LIQFO
MAAFRNKAEKRRQGGNASEDRVAFGLEIGNLDRGDGGGDGVVEEKDGEGEGKEEIRGEGRREVVSERRRKRNRMPTDWREVKQWTSVLLFLCAISGNFWFLITYFDVCNF